MKAIGIPQPGAWLVINEYYNRIRILDHPIKYRGKVLIYALPDPVSPEQFNQFLSGCEQHQVTSHPRMNEFELGGFLGHAELTGYEIDSEERIFAQISAAEELGFYPSKGRPGFFNFKGDPFAISEIPRPEYIDGDLSNYPVSSPNSGGYERSILDDILDGAEEQARRELRGIGRDLAKGAFTVGTDILGGWLGGGKPRKKR